WISSASGKAGVARLRTRAERTPLSHERNTQVGTLLPALCMATIGEENEEAATCSSFMSGTDGRRQTGSSTRRRRIDRRKHQARPPRQYRRSARIGRRQLCEIAPRIGNG